MRAFLLFVPVLLLLTACRGGDTEPLQYRSDQAASPAAAAQGNAYAADPADTFVGSWTYTAYISPNEIREISEDPIPPGVDIDMTAEGSTTYHANSRYDTNAEITIRVRQAGQEIPLRMLRRDAGTWEVQDDVLFETVTSGTLTALDGTTEQFLDETPEFAAFVSPIQGETASTSILSSTPTAIDLQEQESQLRFTLRRDK